MLRTPRPIVLRALTLGIATGLRSQLANGMLAAHYDDAPRWAGWRTWPVFRSETGRKALLLSSVGELIGDKLPMTPSRLEPGPLVGRIAFGGLAGAAIGSESSGRMAIVRGALFGMVGSVIGNYGGYHARRSAVEASGLPDPVVAVAEDAIALALARTAVRS